jgi:hypothetical protein
VVKRKGAYDKYPLYFGVIKNSGTWFDDITDLYEIPGALRRLADRIEEILAKNPEEFGRREP